MRFFPWTEYLIVILDQDIKDGVRNMPYFLDAGSFGILRDGHFIPGRADQPTCIHEIWLSETKKTSISPEKKF